MFNFFKNLFGSKYPQRNSGGFLRRRKAMQCVYAGPDQMNRFKHAGRMEKVYAGPPPVRVPGTEGVYMGPPHNNEPVMEAVYMGPPDEDCGFFEEKKELSEFQASEEQGKPEEERNQSEDDQRPIMREVYMGPPQNKA